MENKNLNCIICNKLLEETQLFFCSLKCKNTYYGAKNNNKETTLKCLVCGNILKGNQRMYCSNDCRWRKHSQIKRKKDYYKKWQREYQKRSKWKNYHKSYQKKYLPKMRDYFRYCLGNKCYFCDFNEVLDFHHIEERNGRKENICSIKRIEGGNIILLCPNHHALVHRGKIKFNKQQMREKVKEILKENKSKIQAGKIRV